METISFLEMWDSKDSYQHKQISIRGFLYKNGDGDFVLAPLPNLRSCCLQGEKPHLILGGEFAEPLPQNVVVVSGILKDGFLVDAKLDEQGYGLSPIYWLLALCVGIYCVKKAFFKDTLGKSLSKK